MPEASEIKLTAEYLESTLAGKMVKEWIFCDGIYIDKLPNGFDIFDENLPLTVKTVDCKGKMIYFILEDSQCKKYYIIHYLSTNGRWQNFHDNYCTLFIELVDGVTIWYRDKSGLGTFKFTTDKEVLIETINSLGLDIMRPEFTLSAFKKLITEYGILNITSFLVDQKIIAGCGNYIKCEALFYAGISPHKKVKDLTERQVELLYEALRIIPRVSYNNYGLSIDDYADENGEKGNFSKELKIFRKITAKKVKTLDGMLTYWDPKVQV